MKYPFVTFDEDADALYVCLADAEVVRTVSVGDVRMVDYAVDGSVVGVEFLGASSGVELNGIPEAAAIARAIGESHLPAKVLA